MPRSPAVQLPCRHIEQDNLDAGRFCFRSHLFRRVLVRKEKLDRFEARIRSRLEPVEERNLVKHHGEIRCKPRHTVHSPFR